MGARGWFLLTLFVLIGGVGALFWVQNSLRLVDLSLDLYFFAFKFSNPVPAPALVLGTLGLGAVLGALLTMLLRRPAAADGGAGRTGSGGAPSGDLWT